MKINIFGSTGIIGSKSLNLLKKYYPEIKVNLLVANNNYKKLITQCKTHNPKYICIKNNTLIDKIKSKINKNIKIINHKDLNIHLNKNKTDLTILAISGYDALLYFEPILKSTKNLGLVNKEVIVSAGHLFNHKFLKKTNIFPIDSEHFSLFNYFENNKCNFNEINKIYLTASGGPFLNFNLNSLKNVTYKETISHPKWKMGFKNSIDSATLANKCLELIEAHYLFKIPYDKLEILIHPESLVHSIIEFKTGISYFNYFYNDMDIPILNFLSSFSKKTNHNIPKKYFINNSFNLNFLPPDEKKFPIYKSFKKIIYKSIRKKIIFNVVNQYAVELYQKNKIDFIDINQYVDKYLSLDFKMPLSNIKQIIDFQKNIEKELDLANEN